MIEKQIPSEAVIEQIKEESKRFHGLMLEVGKIIVGQTDIVQAILMAILCDGHILLEGVPGVAKTTMVKAVAQALGLDFKRIQFTPDLLPSDLIGSLIFNQKTHEFETRKGPIFANLILADEINRAPSKVQAALLEGMQERQVTIGSTTYKLDKPFLVFATQNPIEQEGTYRLPEAQLDRFLFKLSVRYPAPHEEKEIVKRSIAPIAVSEILHKEDINRAHGLVQNVYCDEKILDYIVSLVFATRMPANYKLAELTEFIEYGVSPRATLALYNAAKANAFLKGRHFVTPDDVKSIALMVLGHRISLTYHAEAVQMTPEAVIKKIINTISTP